MKERPQETGIRDQCEQEENSIMEVNRLVDFLAVGLI
jgi:hypothetical protein